MAQTTDGLTDELSAYFTAQLDLERVSKDGGCIRSEVEGECFDAGVDLEGEHYEGFVVQVCRFCHKPRIVQVPDHLEEAVGVAAEFSLLKSGGATFAYPEVLSPRTWACIKGLQRAERNESWAAHRAREEKADHDRRQRELQAMVNR